MTTQKAGGASFPDENGTRTATRRTVGVTALLAALGLAALALSWVMDGKGMEWKVGPEAITQIHAASAHFPIGLLLTSAAFEVAGLLLRRQDFTIVAFWTLLAGTAGAVGTAVVGFLGNPFVGDTSEMGQKVLLRQKVGSISAILFLLLAVWRVARRGRMGKAEGAVIALATLFGVAFVSATGYLGGHLME